MFWLRNKKIISGGHTGLCLYYLHTIKLGFLMKRPISSLFIGSYMSAHVLLNILNELRKRDKM